MANPPPKPPERPAPSASHLLTDSYILAQINEPLKSDRLFHAMITDKAAFTQFLANIGKIPFTERGSIAKNITGIVDLNPRLLQDNNIFNSVIQIMKNIPEKAPEFQELAGKIMLKLREALIKNRGALNLYHKPMADYSETIRAFLALIPAKPKGNFLSSFDQTILDFIMGKASEAQQAQKTAEREARIATQVPFADDEEDEEQVANKMQRLIKMMFADVMRLEPELVSAVILSLVTQLPHGSMIIEDKKMRQDLMQRLDIV